MPRVFLSYNWLDRTAVIEVARILRELGIETFFDGESLVPGQRWLDSLQSAVADCDAAAIFLGPAGIGRWQMLEMQLALNRHAREPGFSVIPVLLPGHDTKNTPLGFLELLTWVDLTAVRTEDVAKLAAAARGEPQSLRPHADVAASVNPYRGLHAFREEDASFFFGREALADEIVALLATHLFVGVVGGSGTGKSSIVKAGVVPRLRDPIRGLVWAIISIRPGSDPLRALAEGFGPLIAPNVAGTEALAEQVKLSKLFRDANKDALSIAVRFVAEANPGIDRILLFVDQFEELFTLADDEVDRKTFISLMTNAVLSRDVPLYGIATMRSDQYNHITDDPDLGRMFAQSSVNVPAMALSDVRQAMVDPARKLRLSFEAGLPERILADMVGQENALPLLQYLLEQLFIDGHASGVLTHAAYDARGGVKRAIATRASEVYAKMSPAEQVATRALLLRLVRPGQGSLDSKRPAARVDLDALSSAVVDRLADWETRLLVTDTNSIELAHEVLIREWDDFRGWIDAERKDLMLRDSLEAEAARWDALSAAEPARAKTLLLPPGLKLEEGRSLLTRSDGFLSGFDTVRRFVEASTQAEAERFAEQARRLRVERLQRRVALAAAGLFAVVAGGAGWFWYEAQVQTRAAVAAREQERRAGDALRGTAHRAFRTLNAVTELLGDDRTRSVPGIGRIQRDVFAEIVPALDEVRNRQRELFGDAEAGAIEMLKAEASLALINMEILGGMEPIAAAETVLRKLLDAHSRLQAPDSDRRALEEVVYNTGLRVMWRLMEIGRVRAATVVRSEIVKLIDPRADVTANSSFFSARARFLNGLARLARSTGQAPDSASELSSWLGAPLELSDAMGRDAQRALDMEPYSEPAKELAAVAAINRRLDLRRLGRTDDGDESFRNGCLIVEELFRAAPHLPRNAGLKAHCAVTASYGRVEQHVADDALAKAEDALRATLFVSPDSLSTHVDLLAVLARRAVNAQRTNPQHPDASLFGRRALEQLTQALRIDDRLPPMVGSIVDSVRDVSRMEFGDARQRQLLFAQVFDAIASKSDRYTEVADLAEAAALIGAELAKLVHRSDAARALEIRRRSIIYVDRSGLLTRDLSSPNETYDAACGLFSNQSRALAEASRLDEARDALRDMRMRCSAILAAHPWDFYLRQHMIAGARSLGLALHLAARHAEAITELSEASHWGEGDASRALADILRRGLAGTIDVARADALDRLAPQQTMKRFTIPSDFHGVNHPFHVYIRAWPEDYPYLGIEDQVEWLSRFRGGTIPQVVRDSFIKLHRIARESNISFPELAAYAIGQNNRDIAGQQETQTLPR